MKPVVVSILLSMTAVALFGQSVTYTINRAPIFPELDGYLTDSVWAQAMVADQFTTTLPRFGATPKNATIVRMLAFPNGICIAVDCKTDHVRADGSARENTGTADYFSVGFDTWNDDQNAFVFTVTAAGQLITQQISSGNTVQPPNSSWEAVCRSDKEGWTAEIWIPFVALRFPAKGEQVWGLQFTRFDRSAGETTTWSPQDPLIRDEVWQYGRLDGLGAVQQNWAVGLTLTGNAFAEATSNSAPLKLRTLNGPRGQGNTYGRIQFNSATTLDFTTYSTKLSYKEFDFAPYWSPDYSTTPFNTESQEIFDRSATYRNIPFPQVYTYYPLQPNQVIESASGSSGIFSFRLTSRTRKGLSLGMVNTVFSRPVFHIYTNDSIRLNFEERYPVFPNYNQLVVEKKFRNNTWIHFSNSNLLIKDRKNSNVSAINTQWRDISNHFEIKGEARASAQSAALGKAFSVLDGQFSAAKINSKWNYGFSWTSPQNKTSQNLIYVRPYIPSDNHFVKIFLTKRNFLPDSSRWISLHQGISAYSFFKRQSSLLKSTKIGWDIDAIDPNYRNWQAGIFIIPALKRDELNFGTSQLFSPSRFLPVHLYGRLNTDTRKTWGFNSLLDITADIHSNGVFHAALYAEPYWVIHSKLTMKAHINVRHSHNQFIPITGLVNFYSFVYQNSNRVDYSAVLEFAPSPQWQIHVIFTAPSLRSRSYKAWEILPDGQIAALNYDAPDVPKRPVYSGYCEIFWTPSNLYRVALIINNSTQKNLPIFMETFTQNKLSAELSFIASISSND